MKSAASTNRKKATVNRKRYLVKKPATLKDYIRILGMNPSVREEAKKLEKALCRAS
jgi:predicted nucleotidyltransferase